MLYSFYHATAMLSAVVVSTVATPAEWQCKIRTGGVRRLPVANGPNIFQMLLVSTFKRHLKTHLFQTAFNITPLEAPQWALVLFWLIKFFTYLFTYLIPYERQPLPSIFSHKLPRLLTLLDNSNNFRVKQIYPLRTGRKCIQMKSTKKQRRWKFYITCFSRNTVCKMLNIKSTVDWLIELRSNISLDTRIIKPMSSAVNR